MPDVWKGLLKISVPQGEILFEAMPAAPPLPALPRLLSKIAYEPNTGCWLWMGSCGPDGYGQMSHRERGRSLRRAHIVSFELHKGRVPAGFVLDHKCRIRCCVNPDHLEPVTDRENVLRGVGRGAISARMTICIRGHELSRIPGGKRYCPTCSAERKRRSHANLG